MASKSIRTLLIDDYKIQDRIVQSESDLIRNIPPQLLRTGTHAKLQESIDKYSIIKDLYEQFPKILSDINQELLKLIYDNYLINLLSRDLIRFNYCIGGSVAWNKIFKEYYKRSDIMSDYEKSAIHETTIDLYNYITINNKQSFNLLINELEVLLKEKIDVIIRNPDVNGNDLQNIEIYKKELETSTILKIYMNYNFQDKLIKVELINAYFYYINSEDEEEENDDFEDTIQDLKTINLDNLKDSRNYLNIYGLYIYNYINKKSTKPIKNDYDIYNVRDQIFNKYILFGDNKNTILKNLIDIYKISFGNSKIIYDKYFIKNIKKLIFNQTENLKLFEDTLKYYLIEKFRPYINYIITIINNELNEARLPSLFSVGGDSCRRYKNTISKTEDIDTKLYLNNKEELKKAEKIIIRRVNQLIAFFIVNKDNIINRIELLAYLDNKGYNDDYVRLDDNNNLNFIYYDTDTNIKHHLTYYLTDENSTFFRFRHTFSSVFPVDLYASDFQIKTNYKIYDNEILSYEDNEITFDMAYLDISVDILKDEPRIIHINPNHILSNNLYVARLLFLIIDLINTYNNDESSIMRLINGKNKKDYYRFIELVKIYNANLFIEIPTHNNLILNETDFSEFPFNSIEDRNLVLSYQENNNSQRKQLDIIIDIGSQFSNKLIKIYSDYFIKDYNKKRKVNKERIVFNFDLNKLNKYSGVSIRRGGDNYLSKPLTSIIKKSSYKLPKKLNSLKSFKNIENSSLDKNQEFIRINNIINMPNSYNKNLLSDLLKSIKF